MLGIYNDPHSILRVFGCPNHALLFSWYYRHTYMSWYIDMYMIYIRTVLVFLNIDVLRCDAGRLFGFYVAGVAAFVRVK